MLAFSDTIADSPTRAIIDWCAALGVPRSHMSDGPTHFKNETIQIVAKGLPVPHHFTLACMPWSNGAVERSTLQIMRVFRVGRLNCACALRSGLFYGR